MTGRNILLVVTGGIAAYKSAEIARGLVKQGALVRVVMTANACRFIAPLTFQAITSQPVFTDGSDFLENGEMSHIALAREADVVLIAPATANIIGKMANGIADDLVSTLLLTVRQPVLVAPAMNCRMYEHPAVQRNLRTLRADGIETIGPCTGELACGEEGAGRMADPREIIAGVAGILKGRDDAEASAKAPPKSPKDTTRDMDGLRVVVTAGPTREAIDAVRFLSNRSSGKMGYAIAEAAVKRGAKVVLISGPTSLPRPSGLDSFLQVTTAAEMKEAVIGRMTGTSLLIMAAAVADYRPAGTALGKIKKDSASLTVQLERTDDILMEIGARKDRPVTIGFAAETENLVANAQEKLNRKRLDMIVANDVSRPDIGFDSEQNEVTVITAPGATEKLPLMTKSRLADEILERVLNIFPVH